MDRTLDEEQVAQVFSNVTNALSILLQALDAVSARDLSLLNSAVAGSGECSGESVHPPPMKLLPILPLPATMPISDSKANHLPRKQLPPLKLLKKKEPLESIQMNQSLHIENLELCSNKRDLYGKRKLSEAGATANNQRSHVLENIEQASCSKKIIGYSEVIETEAYSADDEIRSKVPRNEQHSVSAPAGNVAGNVKWADCSQEISNENVTKVVETEGNIWNVSSADIKILSRDPRTQEHFVTRPASNVAGYEAEDFFAENLRATCSRLASINVKGLPEKKKVTFALPGIEADRKTTSPKINQEEPEIITID